MAKLMLIDSCFGMVRTAIAQGGKLLDYYEESPDQGRSKGNIYKGVVKKVDPHIQAAFVRYGQGRDGFLPLRDVSSRGGGDAAAGKPPPRQGEGVLVQVVKDEVGGKGAALTTKLSLSGRYLVYLPDKNGDGGVSSRVTDEARSDLKKALIGLAIPDGGSVILRTAALNRGPGELQADLDRLVEAHRDILAAGERQEPGLVHREAPPVLRYLREYYTPDVERIWVNGEDALEECRQFFERYEPKGIGKLALSPDGPLLFQKLGLEAEVEKLSLRKVVLPSGANIVIDETEALVAIDVNSAKTRFDPDRSQSDRSEDDERADAKGGRREMEETAYAVNLEAAAEIARQLRLRDLGGIIIADFIDMDDDRHRRQVEEAMRQALAADKAKVKVFEISPLGLMQISRQRLRKAGAHFSRTACEACQGRGWQAAPAAASLAVLRRMEDALRLGKGGRLHVTAPFPIANRLLNEMRLHVLALEERHGCAVRVTALPAESGEASLSLEEAGAGGDSQARSAGVSQESGRQSPRAAGRLTRPGRRSPKAATPKGSAAPGTGPSQPRAGAHLPAPGTGKPHAAAASSVVVVPPPAVSQRRPREKPAAQAAVSAAPAARTAGTTQSARPDAKTPRAAAAPRRRSRRRSRRGGRPNPPQEKAP